MQLEADQGLKWNVTTLSVWLLTFFKILQLSDRGFQFNNPPHPVLIALTKPLLTDYHGKSDFSDHLEKNGVKSPSMTT